MADSLREHYEDEDNCRRDLQRALEAFANPETTPTQYSAVQNHLSLICVLCPVNMKHIVRGIIKEGFTRRLYFELNFWQNKRKNDQGESNDEERHRDNEDFPQESE